ncbi:cobalamin adenosyltransferase, putative [Leishmania panamensis]|uniref:Cobalamin adenosyltransferase, putative n=2 Tax=Leishmania guyanensis species complex TaxID=38579 RepID=A0A088RSA6_LEIPA|nr:cobalamin adenosyltransferase, putative [Leishmania panamensis]AIN98853.1 cobalamin adenosyltransferase, putative [Leishmania panamensis]
MWRAVTCDTPRATAIVFAVMALSALVYTTVRRGGPRVTHGRFFSGCTCASPMATIDPVVAEENPIERRLTLEIKALHAQAMANGEDTYIDPCTGFTVLTRLGLMRNMKCCGNRCRHCPFGHVNVQSKRLMTTKAEGPFAATSASSAATSAEASSAARTAAAKDGKAASGGNVPKRSMVYTKTGDNGTSALFTGERRKKADAVFEALGAIDELSSHVGLASAMLRSAAERREHDEAMMSMLEGIQQELLNAGTVVATPTAKNPEDEATKHMITILEGYRFLDKTEEIARNIDIIDSRLTPLRVFILPGGGNVASAQLHVCRTTCRRAERRMVKVRDLYGETYTDHLRQATVYVNRLSDFFFVAARSIAEEDIVRKYN